MSTSSRRSWLRQMTGAALAVCSVAFGGRAFAQQTPQEREAARFARELAKSVREAFKQEGGD